MVVVFGGALVDPVMRSLGSLGDTPVLLTSAASSDGVSIPAASFDTGATNNRDQAFISFASASGSDNG